jgi:rubredoxin
MSAESESSAEYSQSTESGTPESVAPEAMVNGEATPEAESAEPEVLSPEEMDCYECRACGYSYEPAKGDSRAKIGAGTPFEELPVNWRCPVCGAPKKQFSNIGPVGAPSGFKENLNYGLGVNRLTPGQKNLLIFGALALGFLFFLSLYGLK